MHELIRSGVSWATTPFSPGRNACNQLKAEGHFLPQAIPLAFVCLAVDPFLEEGGVVELVEFGLDRAYGPDSLLSLFPDPSFVLAQALRTVSVTSRM